jgi:aryl-alcohol dehydrogenase-like predicted oxidoreductase
MSVIEARSSVQYNIICLQGFLSLTSTTHYVYDAVYSRPFVTSTVIGASNLVQLEEAALALNLANADEGLDTAILDKLESVYERFPSPTKTR